MAVGHLQFTADAFPPRPPLRLITRPHKRITLRRLKGSAVLRDLIFMVAYVILIFLTGGTWAFFLEGKKEPPEEN